MCAGYADFKPWNGNGPEDRFSEKVITQGYYDKPPAQVPSEQTSAKATLFPALKHKSGLHTLSTLFTGIMNQRRHSGQITSASTFKPPPRVTLTDTKREVWLRDLANPAISLRRLSRTIPHGIRGRILLDQCLNKNVPTDRAVWLAKCVGANEIRAFKRKGVNGTFVMGGETKWIRDWTIHIEQFVESVVGAFGENEWKTRVQYA
jgi:mediator of RNA polymerase II transcription subunit 12, fungi type